MEKSKSHQTYDVVIVGGGPVGNFLGLALVKAGLETLIIEAEPQVAQSARAIVYGWLTKFSIGSVNACKVLSVRAA